MKLKDTFLNTFNPWKKIILGLRLSLMAGTNVS